MDQIHGAALQFGDLFFYVVQALAPYVRDPQMGAR